MINKNNIRFFISVLLSPFHNLFKNGISYVRISNVRCALYTYDNIGDSLGPVVIKYLLSKKRIPSKNKQKRTLMSVGSTIGFGHFDTVIWGSGILSLDNILRVSKQSIFRKYDIRAVRGPLTHKILSSNQLIGGGI